MELGDFVAFNNMPNDFRIIVSNGLLSKGYIHLDSLGSAVCMIICLGVAFSTKGSSRFN